MKSRITLLNILLVSIAFVTSAQNVENDDIYFRSKDRVIVAASKPLKMYVPSEDMEVVSKINPTDSYSARNVNPEYLSQSKLNPSASNAPVSYFVPNYMPTSVNQGISNNSESIITSTNGYYPAGSSAYSSYYGGMPVYGSPYSSFDSPYGYSSPYGYNSFYSPYGFGSPFNSFYGPGMYSGLSMTMGFGGFNSWGGYPYGNSFGMNSFGMGMGFGGYYGYNQGFYCPSTAVVVTGNGDSNGSQVVYGKRSSRSTDLNNNVTTDTRNVAPDTRSTGIVDTQGRSRGASGRIASSEGNNPGNYYQRGWRTNPETNPNRSAWSNLGRSLSEGSGNIGSTMDGRSNTSSGSRNSGSFFNDSGSRNSNWGGSSNFSSGGGSRSSGVSSGGGSSGGARRGRD